MVEFAEKLRNLQRACTRAFLQEELRAAVAVSQESTREPSVKQSLSIIIIIGSGLLQTAET